MKYCYITFRSVTPAQTAESLLRRTGVKCAIQRTPRWMEEQGCGYCLRLAHANGLTAAEILRENGIAFRKVYGQRENGTYEEIRL